MPIGHYVRIEQRERRDGSKTWNAFCVDETKRFPDRSSEPEAIADKQKHEHETAYTGEDKGWAGLHSRGY